MRADIEAELDFAEEHQRHVTNDEVLVETGVIRAVLARHDALLANAEGKP
jgi:hypothetical protein